MESIGLIYRLKIVPFIGLLLGLFLTGCVGPLPYVPKEWASESIAFEQVDESGDQPLLQIFICYGPMFGDHAAVRLNCPGKPVLFWDPGGTFGDDDRSVRKSNYLVSIDAPSVSDYLKWLENRSVAVEVFEFELPKKHADEFWDVLKNWTSFDDPRGRFTTKSAPMHCSTDASDLIKRFASPRVVIDETYFWPHDLAKKLYVQNPDRVIIYRQETHSFVVMRPRR